MYSSSLAKGSAAQNNEVKKVSLLFSKLNHFRSPIILSVANSRLVSVTELCAFQIAPYLFYTHTQQKNWNIPIFFALVRSLMNVPSLVLRLGCMVYFSLNAVGAPKSNAGMGGYPLVSDKCLY